MKQTIRAILLLLGFLAAGPATAQLAVQHPLSNVLVSPSLWHIKGEAGDVYLLGSVHVLPPGLYWRTRPIAAALARSEWLRSTAPQM